MDRFCGRRRAALGLFFVASLFVGANFAVPFVEKPQWRAAPARLGRA